MVEITVDKIACVRCGACVDVCNIAQVFEPREDGYYAAHPERCWRCGHCVAVCPVDAIDHSDFPLEDAPIIEPDLLPSLESLEIALRSRRSCRAFKDEPVARDIVRRIISIGRWAPTAHNSQSVDWVAIDDRPRIAELAKATIDRFLLYTRLAHNPLLRLPFSLAVGRENARTLRKYRNIAVSLSGRWRGGDDPIFYRAPVVLAAHTPAENPFGCDDAGYAAYNVILAAERLRNVPDRIRSRDSESRSEDPPADPDPGFAEDPGCPRPRLPEARVPPDAPPEGSEPRLEPALIGPTAWGRSSNR